jgi:hypothetical protein
MKSKMKIFIYLSLVLVAGTSCADKLQVSFPKEVNNYGENLFNLPSGIELNPTQLLKGESYSLEANLSKKATLRAVFTNTSEGDVNTITRWLFTYKKGWYADNYVNKKQEFTTSTIGNNDLKIVFQGDSGSCRLDVYKNGEATPSDVKFFAW